MGAQPVKKTTGAGTRLTTAALIGDLTDALKDDDHLEPSLAIPAKENGLDVEGLVVFGHRVLLGLRGPVLRSWATVLEVEPTEDPEDPTRLRLGSPPYRKHFLELGDLGVRDLARDGEHLLVLAGPPMGLDGPVRVYRWRNAADAQDQQIVTGTDLELLTELPFGKGKDHAEGIAVISLPGVRPELLVVSTARPIPASPRARARWASSPTSPRPYLARPKPRDSPQRRHRKPPPPSVGADPFGVLGPGCMPGLRHSRWLRCVHSPPAVPSQQRAPLPIPQHVAGALAVEGGSCFKCSGPTQGWGLRWQAKARKVKVLAHMELAMASVLQTIRDRIRRRTHGGVGSSAGQLEEGQKFPRYDKTLDEFAEMAVLIGTAFGTGSSLIPAR